MVFNNNYFATADRAELQRIIKVANIELNKKYIKVWADYKREARKELNRRKYKRIQLKKGAAIMTRYERLENVIKQARERVKQAIASNDKINFDFYMTVIRKARYLQENPLATMQDFYKA